MCWSESCCLRKASVHLIHRFSIQVGADIFCADIDESLSRLARCPGNVWGEITVFGGEERIVGCGWFGGDDVGSVGGELVAVEGFGHGGIIDKGTSASVDEDGRRLHGGEPFGIYEVEGVFGEGTMERDDVALLEEGVKVGFLDAVGEVVFVFRCVGHDLKSETCGDTSRGHACVAKADDTHLLAVEFEEVVVEIAEVW